MQWVTKIAQAMEMDRFELFCQPIVHLASITDECRFYEVLIRMLDDYGRLVLPGAFIPAAERYDMIISIDRWVISNVFEFLHNWEGDDDLSLSINLSGQSLADYGLLDYIETNLKDSGLGGHRLCFEIAESAATVSLYNARLYIERLKKYNCRFSLDNFGSGVSSFSYLKNLPVDYLKIDGALVRDIAHDPVDYALVAAINQIGHSMKIKTIAEFVENQ